VQLDDADGQFDFLLSLETTVLVYDGLFLVPAINSFDG